MRSTTRSLAIPHRNAISAPGRNILRRSPIGRLDSRSAKNLCYGCGGRLGLGKTAVAQSSAEALKLLDKLLATLFFSRSSTDRDDPRRAIPSLVYQITTHCAQFANIIDERLRKDRSLTTKALSTQFDELLVNPLSQLDAATRTSLKGGVIIIDGLDECRGTAEQCEIIRIIAASARNGTTPFRWFITSRPEDPIIRTMNTPSVSSVVHSFELPVSREIDHEILLYLVSEFKKIRESHGLPEAWPSEEVLALLVERGAGLWIYVSTIVRFVNDENSLGPEDQLDIVLRFIGDVSKKVGPNNPLAEMDFFYAMIMQRVPSDMLEILRRIVLICSMSKWVRIPGAVLGLSERQLRRYCVFIQSVMELKGATMADLELNFYHTSFDDYLMDRKRSGAMCVSGEFLFRWRNELLEWLHFVCSRTKGGVSEQLPSTFVITDSFSDSSHFKFPAGTALSEETSRLDRYEFTVQVFWQLCAYEGQKIDVSTAESISKLPFRKMFILIDGPMYRIFLLTDFDRKRLWQNLPIEFRDKIIRKEMCPSPGCIAAKYVWILGRGGDEVHLNPDEKGRLWVRYDPNGIPLPAGNCPCGAQFQDVEYETDDESDDDDDSDDSDGEEEEEEENEDEGEDEDEEKSKMNFLDEITC
ncbi:hypothetical protein NP233_g10117 [Leucocoprinus birnbaumii]|uniref:Nephrocystin 3-like N-terminal domain-containing protein n=1 Tax=Leucocoprinus birnbaumii TaxID=56174 RepID=A0AAD5VJ53_9AGAR|nr:hypothetical protein NP233_g10117 [Leucocoprinus birnbaumii]